MKKSKFTLWEQDGPKGKKISKKLRSKYERRSSKEEIRRELYGEEDSDYC